MILPSRVPQQFKPGTHVHMIGIGGVGMAALARILSAEGCTVTGTDLEANRFTNVLQSEGVKIQIGHDAEAVGPKTQICIYSTAIQRDHVERVLCREKKIPSFQRGVAFSAIARGEGSIAVTGTHGKTTTTAMLTHLMHCMDVPCDYFIGGEGVDGTFFTEYKQSPYFVFEADESDGTLVHYHPDHAIITNIDYDHMEHHANEECFFKMFSTFIQQVKGCVVVNAGCQTSQEISQQHGNRISFGIDEALATVNATDVESDSSSIAFNVVLEGMPVGRAHLPVPGYHMVENALAAIGMLHGMKNNVAESIRHLSTFQPVKRRMEVLYESGGLKVYTDYAHHPTELLATLKVLEKLCSGKLRVVFQPHRFTRTQALMLDFVDVLKGAYELFIAPVYAASESLIPEGRSEVLVDHLLHAGQNVRFDSDMKNMIKNVISSAQSGDVIAVLGAGDIDAVAREVIREQFAASKENGHG